MDFSTRTQPQNAAPGAAPAAASGSSRKSNQSSDSKLGRIAAVVSAVVVAILLILVIFVVATKTGTESDNGEQKLVDTSKLQAVFLSTGQVYFGKVTELNSKYFVVNNIYYLQTSSTGTTATNANTSVSLVKLGCELHSPYDKMVINRSQVTFWENLQDTGQVAKAVKTFQQQNPNGQKCSDTTAASTTNNVQGTTNTNSNAGANTTTTTR
ncbi:MAG: hypothetical protein JWN38_754 [Candidatus Saccharibacteria bacterium]|nr:hypothetical protein [Candidatus Saccharibacteria bacterium]